MKTFKLWSWLCAVVIAGLTVVAVIAATKVVAHLNSPPPHDADYYKYCLNVLKIVVGGIVIGALGIVVPAAISYSKDKFERLKESRAAYSGAKTGIDYLSLRLITANLAEAGRLIQEVHFQKHQAQLYDKELRQHLRLRHGYWVDLDDWDEVMYRKLRSVRILLKNHAAEWDGLNQIDRLKILQPYLPDVDETSAKSKPFKEEKKWWRRSQAGQ